MSMFDDQKLVEAWQSNIVSPADEAIVWRRYVLACAAYHCVQLEEISLNAARTKASA